MSKARINGKEYDLSIESERTTYWTVFARSKLLGRRITAVRYLSKSEGDQADWSSRCPVIVLDSGMQLYPVSDDAANEAGALFGQDMENGSVMFPKLR